jgi:hypothetical protein
VHATEQLGRATGRGSESDEVVDGFLETALAIGERSADMVVSALGKKREGEAKCEVRQSMRE